MNDLLSSREKTLSLLEEYESLLSPKQRDILAKYFRFDLSLSEIAEEEGISRTAVHDALKKGVQKLERFEENLRLAYWKNAMREAHALAGEKEKLEAYETIYQEIDHGI